MDTNISEILTALDKKVYDLEIALDTIHETQAALIEAQAVIADLAERLHCVGGDSNEI